MVSNFNQFYFKSIFLFLKTVIYKKRNQSKMSAIRNFFCEFDFFAAPTTLRIGSDPETKSVSIGVISFLFFCLFGYVFIDSSLEVINMTDIDSKQTLTLIKSNKAKGSFPTFAVTLDYLPHQTFKNMFQFQILILKNSTITRTINMKPCTVDQWAALGEDAQQQFDDYFLAGMLCPDGASNFQMRETYINPANLDFLVLTLKACNPGTNPSCNRTNAENYIISQSTNGNAFIYLYALDDAVKPEQVTPSQKFINIETLVPVSKKIGGGAAIEFSTYEVITDYSIFPYPNVVTQTGTMIDTVRTYQKDYDNVQTDTLAYVEFYMTRRLHRINRVVGKLDESLSYSGGLFSLVILFLGFFLMSYNEYKYEFTVAKSLFNNREGGKDIGTHDLNLFSYFKYKIYEWVSLFLFCCKPKWKSCQEMDETREEVNNYIDIGRLFRRIQALEAINKMNPKMGANERMCVNLMETPTITEAKNNRLMMEYFEVMTEGKVSLTMEEAQNINNFFAISTPGAFQISSISTPAALNLTSISNNNNNKNNKILNDTIEDIQMSTLNIKTPDLGSSPYPPTMNYNPQNQMSLEQIMKAFPECQQFAENVQLSDELLEMEGKYADAYSKMKPEVRDQVEKKIPVAILYRLRKRIQNEKFNFVEVTQMQ